MQIQSLGHVVLKVRERARAEAFYGGVLGLKKVAYNEPYRISFYSLGDHHDFAIQEVGADAPGSTDQSVGLQHVAFKIGENLDILRAAKAEFDAAGIETRPVDHGVTKSLYFRDPDGNQLEVYVDVSDVWRADPQTVAEAKPLQL